MPFEDRQEPSAHAPAQVALTALDLARAERFTEIADLFAPHLRQIVVSEALESGWRAELGRQGPVTSIGDPVVEPAQAGAIVVRVPVRCERGGFTLVALATEDGLLAGLQLAPASAAAPIAPWQPPEYADPEGFGEEEITLGSGPLAVPGTLTAPHDSSLRAGVVLLAGSGSLDRDETIGRNKPLKDIAWGLASRGVTVARFDKVTHAHANELKDAQGFTLADEYVPHTIAAVHMLQQHAGVDAGRVFVLGHSLGGTVAPRVAVVEPSIAGLIIVAGGAQPLHRAIVRQFRHLASLNPASQAASEPAIAALSEKAERVDSPDLTLSTPAGQLPLGAPASYWLDVRGYDPAQVAATVDRPMLILQGGRDYQVTVEDDLSRWSAALRGRPDVTIRTYPSHNHLFIPGTGPSTPAEYEPVQHVDAAVVADIAAWIAEQVTSADRPARART